MDQFQSENDPFMGSIGSNDFIARNIKCNCDKCELPDLCLIYGDDLFKECENYPEESSNTDDIEVAPTEDVLYQEISESFQSAQTEGQYDYAKKLRTKKTVSFSISSTATTTTTTSLLDSKPPTPSPYLTQMPTPSPYSYMLSSPECSGMTKTKIMKKLGKPAKNLEKAQKTFEENKNRMSKEERRIEGNKVASLKCNRNKDEKLKRLIEIEEKLTKRNAKLEQRWAKEEAKIVKLGMWLNLSFYTKNINL